MGHYFYVLPVPQTDEKRCWVELLTRVVQNTNIALLVRRVSYHSDWHKLCSDMANVNLI